MYKRVPIIIGILLICLAVWLLLTPNRFIRGTFERLENLGYDLQLRTRVFTENRKLTTPVAIVDIDDKSLKVEGHWPWPRNKLAALADQLKVQGAVVIAFDSFFAEPESNIAELLIKRLKNNTAIISALQKYIPLFNNDVIFAKSIAQNETVL